MYGAQTTIDQVAKIVPLIQLVIVIGSASIAFLAILQTIRINKRNKRADASFHCNTRYDEIQKTKHTLREQALKLRNKAVKQRSKAQMRVAAPEIEPDAQPEQISELLREGVDSYYARFWGLKSDEFDYWLAELIDMDSFFDWSFTTLRKLRENSELVPGDPKATFRSGWERIGRPDNLVSNPWFTEFIDVINKLSQMTVNEVNDDYTLMAEIIRKIHNESENYRHLLHVGMSPERYLETRKRDKLNLEEILDLSYSEMSRLHHPSAAAEVGKPDVSPS